MDEKEDPQRLLANFMSASAPMETYTARGVADAASTGVALFDHSRATILSGHLEEEARHWHKGLRQPALTLQT